MNWFEHLPPSIRNTFLWCRDTAPLPSPRNLGRMTVLAPAVLAGASMLAMSMMLVVSDAQVMSWRREALQRALAAHDDETAQLHYAVLLEKEPGNLKLQYGLAMSLGRSGQDRAALALLDRLTPSTGVGYMQAHVAGAEAIIKMPMATPQQLALAENHLVRVTEIEPHNWKAVKLLALLYCRTGQWAKVSEPDGQRWEELDPSALQLAQAAAERGDRTGAEMWARRAAEFCLAQSRAHARNAQPRLGYARALAMLGDFKGALDALETDSQQTHLEVFRGAAAEVCAAWFRAQPDTKGRDRMEVLEQVLKADPYQPAILAMILKQADLPMNEGLLNSSWQSENSLKPAAAAPTLAATKATPGAGLDALCRSVRACQRCDARTAQEDVTRCLELGGRRMLPVAINLACVWASAENGDQVGALLLLNVLHQISPHQPEVLRAEGMVLSRQVRWPEAIAALESYVAQCPNDAWAHRSLAAAYEQVGDGTRATEHGRLGAATQPATRRSGT